MWCTDDTLNGRKKRMRNIIKEILPLVWHWLGRVVGQWPSTPACLPLRSRHSPGGASRAVCSGSMSYGFGRFSPLWVAVESTWWRELAWSFVFSIYGWIITQSMMTKISPVSRKTTQEAPDTNADSEEGGKLTTAEKSRGKSSAGFEEKNERIASCVRCRN